MRLKTTKRGSKKAHGTEQKNRKNESADQNAERRVQSLLPREQGADAEPRIRCTVR